MGNQFKKTIGSKFMDCMDTFMNILIVLNALAFGLMTDRQFADIHEPLNQFCNFSLILFVVELIIKLAYHRSEFFTGAARGWNIFDMAIIVMSCMASFSFFSSVRVFRIFRVFRQLNILRLIPSAGQLKIIIEALIASLPGVGWTSAFFLIIIYTYALLGTTFFGVDFPDYFGDVWKAVLTLFQVMTLDSWSECVARPVISLYPYAWIFFVTYVVFSAFIILNIIVALVVSSLEEVKTKNSRKNDNLPDADVETQNLVKRIEDLQTALSEIKNTIANDYDKSKQR